MRIKRLLRHAAAGMAVLAAVVACGGGTSSEPRSAATPTRATSHAQAVSQAQAGASVAFSSAARWIWNSTDTADQWVAFRKSFSLASAPSTAITKISVDTHYWLYDKVLNKHTNR